MLNEINNQRVNGQRTGTVDASFWISSSTTISRRHSASKVTVIGPVYRNNRMTLEKCL